MAHLYQSTWGGIVKPQDATFREMQSTGHFGLLADADLRGGLATYYALHAFMSERLFSSSGDYGRVVAEAVPGRIRYAYHSGEPIESAEGREALEALLAHEELRAAVNAELAYAGRLVQWHRELQRLAIQLIVLLEAHYPS